jgi:hypothetical protein
MNLKTKLAASLLLAASTSMAHAATTTYNIAADIFEPTAAAGDTTFHLSMGWDGTSITSLTGTMNSSMFSAVEDINLNGFVQQGAYTDVNGHNWVIATVYKNANSSIFAPAKAGQTTVGLGAQGPSFVFGPNARKTATIDTTLEVDHLITQNAFASFAFDPTNPTNGNLWLTSYGDCTANGMMMAVCMTGHAAPGFNDGTAPNYPAVGTMGAYPSTLTITAASVAAVPVPAAAWLFGGALMSLLGVSRRKNVLPA